MDINPLVTLVSTSTVDRLPSGEEIPGGPARYVGDALRRLGVSYRLITGERALVEVVPAPEGERYIIPRLKPIPLPDRLGGEAVILSPVMREIDPLSVPPVDGMLAVDLQGFVRTPSRTEAGMGSVDLAPLLERSQVVKASESELQILTEPSRLALQRSLLVLTRGSRGALIRCGTRSWEIEARPVAARHTIGAGDSFLAAFITRLLGGYEPGDAAEQAARFVESLLLERG